MDEKILESKMDLEKRSIMLDKRSSKIALLRLAVFVVMLISAYIGFKNSNIIAIVFAFVLLVVFVMLVRYHGVIDEQVLDFKTKSGVINRYIMRNSNEWKSFKDNGLEFLEAGDNLSRDLDLLGQNSLFQFLSIAHTPGGKKRLAETLSLKRDNIDNISSRYEAISELSKKADFLIDFEALSERILEKKEKDEKRINLAPIEEDEKTVDGKTDQKSDDKEQGFPIWMYITLVFVPVLNIFTIFFVLRGDLGTGSILISYILGTVLTWGPLSIHAKIAEPLNTYGSGAADYYKILKLIAGKEFDSEILKNIHNKTVSKDGFLGAIKSLGTINSCNNIAFNPLLHMVLAGFLGWDNFISLAVFRWSKKNGDIFEDLESIVSEIEELGSLSVMMLVRNTAEPKIVKDLNLDITGAYHPLLNKDTVVSNDAKVNDRLTIITGSNMSGKTTYMRTIAINMVLAYVGTGVCADSFNVPKMKLFTSMRIMDDVSGGISTFYAEILRIKQMAEYISLSDSSDKEEKLPAFCLIDEIFKGTNSADRIVGATEALKKLSRGKALVMVTTHDFELCELSTEDGTPAKNYHFEEYYENGELKFDYKIKNGKCTTRNAMAILEMAGLV